MKPHTEEETMAVIDAMLHSMDIMTKELKRQYILNTALVNILIKNNIININELHDENLNLLKEAIDIEETFEDESNDDKLIELLQNYFGPKGEA